MVVQPPLAPKWFQASCLESFAKVVNQQPEEKAHIESEKHLKFIFKDLLFQCFSGVSPTHNLCTKGLVAKDSNVTMHCNCSFSRQWKGGMGSDAHSVLVCGVLSPGNCHQVQRRLFLLLYLNICCLVGFVLCNCYRVLEGGYSNKIWHVLIFPQWCSQQ